MNKQRRLLFFATKGLGTNEHERIKSLVSQHEAKEFAFDASSVGTKFKSFLGIIKSIRTQNPELTIMEGSGIAGGLALICMRLAFGSRYIVSSGDAISPFLSARLPFLRPIFALYERILYRLSSGFIGWTPYLVGRALTFGAPKGVTAEHWNFFSRTPEQLSAARKDVREKLQIPSDAIVVGLLGSLAWNQRLSYCYGMELVRAAKLFYRKDLLFVIVGDGDGLIHLRREAQGLNNVVFVGSVPLEQVPDYLACFDVASLPQSVDGVGNFRYTTKVSEYLAAGLPVITNQVPMAYDLDNGWFWRIPGRSPWSREFHAAFVEFLKGLTTEKIAAKKQAAFKSIEGFNREQQIERVTNFIAEI